MRKSFLKFFALTSILFFGVGALTNCNGNNDIDYVNDIKDVRLKLDYKTSDGKNRDFFSEGISEVQAKDDATNPYTIIDGDTAHFRMKDSSNKELIKLRFYGIDTPESTGTVEPYGEKAKEFTKTKIEAAKTIVVTSTNLTSYVAPEADSTGTRYLGMIWISEKENCPYNELVLLNLWIVQEGLSYVKNLDKFPSFKDTFISAEEQAKRKLLNLHSGKQDDGFNYGDYEMTDLKVIQDEIIKQLQEGGTNKFNNKRVRVRGTVAGYTNNMLYLQTRFEDEETGAISYAGINVFCGMSPVPSKFTRVNTFLELSALALDSENFGFQLTSVYSFPPLSSSDDPNDTKIIYKADEIPEEYKVHQFEYSAAELATPNYSSLFSPVEVTTNLTVTGGYDSSGTPTEPTLYCSSNGQRTGFTVYVPFLYQPYEDDKITKWDSFEDFVGHTIKVKGIYSFHKSASGNITYQIMPRSSDDITLIS